MLKFGLDFISKPSRAVNAIKKDPRKALKAATGVYAVYLITAALFYTLKPDGFPPPIPGAEATAVEHGLLFWIGVQAWSPVLLAVWIAATGWFCGLLGTGKLAVRMPAALGSIIIPILLFVVYKNGSIPRSAFAATWLILIAVMIPGFRRIKKDDWIRLTASLAGLHAAAILLLLPFTLAVLARSPRAYHAVELVMLFWVLGLASYSVRRVMEIATARAFSAVFLSLVAQILFVFSMYLLGILPKGVLKALMAA